MNAFANDPPPRTTTLAGVALAAALLAACGGGSPAVGETRMVAMPARPADCPLQLVTIGAQEMMPGAEFGAGGRYEMIGAITLGLPKDTDVLSEKVRALVRPRACAMGGAVVSLLAGGNSGHWVVVGDSLRTVTQTDVAFTVWGARADAPGPQKF